MDLKMPSADERTPRTPRGFRQGVNVEPRSWFLCRRIPHDSGDTMPDPTSLLEIGARLAVTRKALGLTQAEMDRRMGSALTNGQTFNFYETGRQRIPTHHALALCRTCNIHPGLDLSRADAQPAA